MSVRILAVLAYIVVIVVQRSVAVTNEAEYIINAVNSDPNNMWKAGDDNVVPGDGTDFRRLMGVFVRNDYSYRLAPIKESVVDYTNEALPVDFDARRRWPKCLSLLNSIKDQSNCGSCWAVSAAAVFSDRLCIVTDGALAKNLSAEHVNNCCYRCGHGCDGGFPEGAWYFFARHGIVTGGDHHSGEGCQPYTIVPCGKGKGVCADPDPDTPECSVKSCTNTNYLVNYKTDLHYVNKVYSLPNSEVDIMAEIYNNGPVQAVFYVYTDFKYYKSGVYRYTRGELEGGHAIKILGWGVENGVKYWLCANSWGRSWGMDGLFKILKGSNECHIEERVLTGTPRVPKHLLI